ncbi:MAG: hypothetical protein IJ057_07625 [Bacteroidales bacterium]|nr:hypothetical protein [Bacteroidales bacterium]
MKKAFILFLIAAGFLQANAQEPYYCTTKGAVLTYTDYDAKGKENGSTVQTFKEVTGKTATTTSPWSRR